MYCNNCGNEETRVSDSRISDNWKSIRRRRVCDSCWNRFTTYEKIENFSAIVEKSWNRKEKYNREKLEDSVLIATNKRNISPTEIKAMIDRLENIWLKQTTLTSKQIWKDILEELKKFDEVSYIRYASVHLNFENSEDFIEFIRWDFKK